MEGIYYTEKYSPTPATALIRMLLVMLAAAKDGELRHFDAEQEFLKANIDKEIYIEIPEEFQESSGGSGTAEQGPLRSRTGGEVLEQQVL